MLWEPGEGHPAGGRFLEASLEEEVTSRCTGWGQSGDKDGSDSGVCGGASQALWVETPQARARRRAGGWAVVGRRVGTSNRGAPRGVLGRGPSGSHLSKLTLAACTPPQDSRLEWGAGGRPPICFLVLTWTVPGARLGATEPARVGLSPNASGGGGRGLDPSTACYQLEQLGLAT